MRQGSLRLVVVAWIILALLVLPSCGFKRKLVSITVSPTDVTLTGAGVELQLKAIGNYIHPPDSRDITNQVTWQSSAPQLITVDSTGLATSGSGCGTNILINASAHSDPHDSSSGLVIGSASVNVAQPPLC